jgi:hypothetical protein
MPTILVIGCLVVGLLVICWSTIFALLEYLTERLDAMDAALDRIVWQEVNMEYLQPTLMLKLERWSASRPYTCHALKPEAAAVVAFVSLQQALVLEPCEMDVFLKLCLHSLRTEFRWYPESYLIRRVEDECGRYVWRDSTIQDLWNQWWAPQGCG